MPIKPENMALYPGGSIRSPEWLAIREQVRARAGNRCEQCGLANGLYIWRMPDAETGREAIVIAGHAGQRLMGRAPIRIVCTVAHVDHHLVDHSLDNLRFWCQRCHNRHDAPARAAGRRKS